MNPVITIDCNYITSGGAASFLLPENDQSIIIEANTSFAVNIIHKSVMENHLKPEDIRYLILTHIHLDHGAGAGHLMELFPNAELLCHPRARMHLENPERLIRSAMMVYGEQRFHDLYGEIRSVDGKRIRVMEDESFIDAGKRRLTFYHTAGHARHHICIHDSLSNGIFTGDSFGLAYPLLQKKGLMIYPATTAIDFDPAEARRSLDIIMNSGASSAFLTHFGEMKEMRRAKEYLLEGLGRAESIMNRAASAAMDEDEVQKFCRKEFASYIDEFLEKLGLVLTNEERKMLNIDIEVNAGGIAYAALRKRKTDY